MSSMKGPYVVTQENIDVSLPHESKKCMVAEAVMAAHPRVKQVYVDLQSIRWTGRRGVRYSFLTPPAVQQMLIAFDQGWTEKLKPFTFHLGPPVQQTRPKAEGDQSKLTVKENIKRETGRNPTTQHATHIGGKAPPEAALGTGNRRYGVKTAKP